MRQIFSIFFLIGALIVGLTTISQAQEIPAPAYVEGENWVYRITRDEGSPEEFRISYKGGKFVSDNQTILGSAIYVAVHMNDPKRKWLDFPLTRGKKWDFQYSHRGHTSRRFEWRNSVAEVMGPTPNPIETPAGKFKAIEIRRTDSGRATFSLVYFYSPDTKSVVKLSVDVDSPAGKSHYNMELIKYSSRR